MSLRQCKSCPFLAVPCCQPEHQMGVEMCGLLSGKVLCKHPGRTQQLLSSLLVTKTEVLALKKKKEGVNLAAGASCKLSFSSCSSLLFTSFRDMEAMKALYSCIT